MWWSEVLCFGFFITDLTLFLSRPWIPAYASTCQCGEHIDMVQGNRPCTVWTLDKKFGEVPWGWAEFVVIVCFIGYWPVILLLHVQTSSGCKWNLLYKCVCWLKEEDPFTYSLVCCARLTLSYILFCWFWCWVVVKGTLHKQGFHHMTLLCQCKFISSAAVRCSWATDKLQIILPNSNSELWVFLVTKNVITRTLILLTVNYKLYIYIYIYICLFIYYLEWCPSFWEMFEIIHQMLQ